MSSVVSSFAATLSERGGKVRQTPADDLGAVLEDAIEPPAVAVPPPELPVDVEDLPAHVSTDPTPAELEAARTGITVAALGIADYGSVVIQGGPEGAEAVSLYPERHLALVAASTIVEDMRGAMSRLDGAIREGNRSHVIATGPSATADMGELVEGAHGPKAVTVVVVTDR
jgi:L-lactate dehydrogenase complex protein LldG